MTTGSTNRADPAGSGPAGHGLRVDPEQRGHLAGGQEAIGFVRPSYGRGRMSDVVTGVQVSGPFSVGGGVWGTLRPFSGVPLVVKT